MGILSFMLGRASKRTQVEDNGDDYNYIDCSNCVKVNSCIDAHRVNVCSTYEE